VKVLSSILILSYYSTPKKIMLIFQIRSSTVSDYMAERERGKAKRMKDAILVCRSPRRVICCHQPLEIIFQDKIKAADSIPSQSKQTKVVQIQFLACTLIRVTDPLWSLTSISSVHEMIMELRFHRFSKLRRSLTSSLVRSLHQRPDLLAVINYSVTVHTLCHKRRNCSHCHL